jgi:hypothetical protein
VLAPVSVGVLATIGAVGATADTPDTPPDSTAPVDTVDPGAAAFERQLAELSFGSFLAIELDVSPDVFTCTEPRSTGPDEMVTCFALVEGRHVVIATSPASGATGRFTFDIVADYEIVEPGAGSTPASDPVATDAPAGTDVDTVPVTYTDAERNDANVAILVYGDQLDQSASTEIGAIVEAANGSILAVSTWRWDAATATFTIDYTVNSDAGLSADESAWLTVNAMSSHWEAGQPFRHSAATIRPSLRLQVSGSGYASDWNLMTQVADGAISDTEWLAAATAG